MKTLVSRGHLIVAAVGNDGPAAPPLYPASYDGVIGVTAVDEKHHVLIEACRGKHVDFAAQGARSRRGGPRTRCVTCPVRGTSFAAPSSRRCWPGTCDDRIRRRRQLVLAKWNGVANDLGKPGRDDIYGAGESSGTRSSRSLGSRQ